MNEAFHKISVEFEYLNEIYDINSEPYYTLAELKEIVSKKIFPHPGDVHCFYKNFDLYEKEDEEISKIFQNKTKIKITLKNPPTVKQLKKLQLNRNNQPIINMIDSYPNFPTIESTVRLPRSKTLINRKRPRFMSLPSMTNDKAELSPKKKLNLQNVNENIKSNDFLFDLFNSTKKKLAKIEKEGMGIKNFIDKNKNVKNKNISLTDKKMANDLNSLLSNLKEKNMNSYKFNNNLKLNSPKNLFLNKRSDKVFKTQKGLLNSKLNTLNLSIDEKKETKLVKFKDDKHNKENKDKTNLDNKKNINENYICNSCKDEMISEYCLNCNEFKCNSCIELCKVDEHKYMKIDLDSDCCKMINSYGEMIMSNIEKKNEEISEYEKEIQIYDIKKFRDDFILLINDILNIYNEFMSILEKIYKEKPLNKELKKFELESTKIKVDINDIIKKANVYLKNDNQISKPKYKMMNMQYFFTSLNTKEKAYNSLTEKMNIYSLNSTINSNIEECFEEIKKSMKTLTNKNNPFTLKDDAKKEYEKLMNNNNKDKKNKRRILKKRNTLSVKSVRLLNLEKIEKTEDIYEESYLDI